MLHTCNVIASINQNIGGPAVTVTRLLQSLIVAGVSPQIITLDYTEHGPQVLVDESTITHNIAAGWLSRRFRGWSPALKRDLIAITNKGLNLVHSHGLWMFPNIYARQAAVLANIPLVISPHGMVEEWSLRRSRWKKLFAWQWYERNNLRAAKLFHASSKEEAMSLRRLGLRQPIAMIPFGIDLPELAAIPGRGILEAKFPELVGKSWLLFLSRLHEKKGVSNLLRVWSELAPLYPDWQLVLAGPDLDGYGEIARREVAELRIATSVTFTGMLAGDDKSCALGNAELFVLPTHSENFGIVIAEALAHECPVITTKGAPWEDLQTYSCGWWIENEAEVLRATLKEAMGTPIDERRAMGRRGRQLMEDKYSWSRVGEQMKAAYLWCCGYGEKTDFIWTE